MKQGDFSELAKNYINRPAYNNLIINSLLKHINFLPNEFVIADVGAGTGKFTKEIASAGCKIFAVEPNDEMRKEGIIYTKGNSNVIWSKGSGEETGLDSNCVNWVTMASSFHWTDPKKSLPEFHRILKSKGFFTIIWNPRNVEASPLHKEIEEMIKSVVPELQRVSSGSQNVKDWFSILTSTQHFTNVVFMECNHIEYMSQERYLGAWMSVNDIRAQAGEERWNLIMQQIQKIIAPYNEIEVPYKMRAWTAQRVD